MTCKERLAGIRLVREDVKPKTYARNGKNPRQIKLHQRAGATSEYLAEDARATASAHICNTHDR